MRVLNLFAGLGGNRKHWDAEVTAVELNPQVAEVYQALYPDDTVIVGDAHQYLIDHFDKFDYIWSSPPCQSHSRMAKATRHRVKKYPDMTLYQEILFLQHFYKGQWVVENVTPFYKPLILPTQVIGRHYFWSNYDFLANDIPSPGNFINLGNNEGVEKLKEWLGIEYSGNIYLNGNHCPGQVLRNCVHPDLGLQIFNQGDL